MEKRKMKLAKYISTAITTLIVFIAMWSIAEATYDKFLMGDDGIKWLFVVIGIIAFIYVLSLSIGVLSYSIKLTIRMFKEFKQEKGLWKILTLVFRLGMLLFASLIAILGLVWLIFMIKDGFVGTGGTKDMEFANRFSWISLLYISGNHGLEYAPSVNSNCFGIFVTIFVFILIWSAAGIAFEILKKILGGYKPKKEEQVQF